MDAPWPDAACRSQRLGMWPPCHLDLRWTELLTSLGQVSSYWCKQVDLCPESPPPPHGWRNPWPSGLYAGVWAGVVRIPLFSGFCNDAGRSTPDLVTSVVVPLNASRYVDPMLVWCWAIVYDACPTLKQHWVNVSCLLGLHRTGVIVCCQCSWGSNDRKTSSLPFWRLPLGIHVSSKKIPANTRQFTHLWINVGSASLLRRFSPPMKTPINNVDLMLVHRHDAGPTSNQHRVNVLCLLGWHYITEPKCSI